MLHDSAHGDQEQQIKKIALELADMHGEKYNDDQFKLWAQMMVNKQHDVLLIFPLLKMHAQKKASLVPRLLPMLKSGERAWKN